MNNTESCIRSEGPEWLDKLLCCNYFSPCTFHKSAKPEKNHFCIECNEGPLCSAGLVSGHNGHQTLQIRKASHHDAIRVCDIQKFIDITGIQYYSINGAKIVFLLRPKAKLHHGKSNRRCINCKRGLHDAGMFMCSIKCKLSAIRDSLLGNHGGNNIKQNNNNSFLEDDSMISLSLSNSREQINDHESIKRNAIVSSPNSNIPVATFKEDCNSRLFDPCFQPLKKRLINYVREMESDHNNSVEGGDCKIRIKFKFSQNPELQSTRYSPPNIKGSNNDSPDSTLQKHQQHNHECYLGEEIRPSPPNIKGSTNDSPDSTLQKHQQHSHESQLGEEIRPSDQYHKMSSFSNSLPDLEDREANMSPSFSPSDQAQHDSNSHHDNHQVQKSFKKSRRKNCIPHRAPFW